MKYYKVTNKEICSQVQKVYDDNAVIKNNFIERCKKYGFEKPRYKIEFGKHKFVGYVFKGNLEHLDKTKWKSSKKINNQFFVVVPKVSNIEECEFIKENGVIDFRPDLLTNTNDFFSHVYELHIKDDIVYFSYFELGIEDKSKIKPFAEEIKQSEFLQIQGK